MSDVYDHLPSFEVFYGADAETPLVEVTITPFVGAGGVRFQFSGPDTENLGALFASYEDAAYAPHDLLAVEALEEVARFISRKIPAALRALDDGDAADDISEGGQ